MTTGTHLTTHTLSNGLTVFLREKHDAAVISFWIWYRVGSRNELPGKTGLSHWVEHMQFKGTERLEKGAIFRDVSRVGGALNAMTSNDWTAYYETVPSDQIELALQIESDRMVNSVFDPDETERERTVILSERQGAENRPTFLLAEEVNAMAFTAHPYGHMVLGYESDLKAITRDDLYHHYRRYYNPANAFITITGDFDSETMVGLIDRYFGAIPAGDPIPNTVATEPPQRGERRITVHRPAPAPYLMMGYRMPEATHPDIPAILMANAILSGAGLNGGGGTGRSSRLYQALVSTGLARSASSNSALQLDPELWGFSATAMAGVEPQRIEEAIEAEIDRLKREPASIEEFAKARKQARANYAYSNETATSQAYWLGRMEIVDHASRVDTIADELSAVTPEDVQQVAETWLRTDQRTVGWQLPAGDTDTREVDADYKVASFSGSEVSSHGFQRVMVRGDIPLLMQSRPNTEVVAATFSMEAGHSATGETHPGLPAITARMLNRGTQRHSFAEFNEAIESIGAAISVDATSRRISIALQSLYEDFDRVLELAVEMLTMPEFPESELEQVRRQAIIGIRERDQDTRRVASRILSELVYPEGHPLRVRTSGTEESVNAISREQLLQYHQTFLAPNVTTIALAGGVPSMEIAVEKIDRVLEGWAHRAPDPHPPVPAPMPQSSASERRAITGKTQADIAIGVPTLSRLHPDYHALNIANIVLGRLGLMGRLGANVRDRQGLAYYASSSLSAGLVSGLWQASAGVDPGNVDKAIEGIRTELASLKSDGITEDELTDAKSWIVGSAPLALESIGGVIGMLLTIEQFDLGLDYVDRLPGIIQQISLEHVHDAVRSHLRDDLLQTGIAGPEVERL